MGGVKNPQLLFCLPTSQKSTIDGYGYEQLDCVFRTYCSWGCKQKKYYFIKISLLSLSSFNHTVTPLSHFSSSFFSPIPLIWCFSQIKVEWRSTLVAWTEDRWWQCVGLEISGDDVVVWSSGDGGFSLSHSNSLFLSLRFSLLDRMWVLVLLWIFFVGIDARFMVAAMGVVVLLVEIGSLWVYGGCYKCGWWYGCSGSVGVPILS